MSHEQLLEKVIDGRTRSLALCIHAQFGEIARSLQANISPLINNHIPVIKAKLTPGFAQWSESELAEYLRWQQSPLVKKTEQALLANAGELDDTLSAEEMQKLNEFNS